MDVYLTSFAIGGIGLVAMAASGFGRHGHNHASGGHTSGTNGHGHTAYGHAAHGHTAPGSSSHGHAAPGNAAHGHAAHASDTLLSLMSPRTLFSVCLGLGTTGLLLRNVLQGPALFAVAVAGGWALERFIVTPIWNFTLRFASAPALTLESALMGEATAVTRFDANGQGLIAIEVDGHMVQLLGTLDSGTRANRTIVLAGTRLRIEDVDAARNRCTVSLL